MRTVIFIAPFLLDATVKFIKAAATVPNTRLVVLTQESKEKLPGGVEHWWAPDTISSAGQTEACRAIARHYGGIHRIVGVLENIQEAIAETREALGVPGTSLEIARRCRDKSLMKTVLREAGLPCARHRLLFSANDAWEFSKEVGLPIVLKPPAGAGCKGTYQINTTDDLHAALAEVKPGAQNVVLAEEFVQGDEFSFDTIIIGGRIVFYNILRYLPGPLDVTRNEWVQWCVVAPRDIYGPEFDEIRVVGPAVLRTLGVQTAMTHMEWFRRANGEPVVSEIAARPPGAQFTSLMSYAYNRNMYRAWAHAVINDSFDGPYERSFAAGCAYLRSPGQGRVARIEGLERVQSKIGPLVVEAQLPEVGRPKSSHYEGDGFIIVRHPDTRVVEDALRFTIENIRVHYN